MVRTPLWEGHKSPRQGKLGAFRNGGGASTIGFPCEKNASHHETENVGSHGKQPYVKNLTKAPISDLIENSLEDCRFELSRKLKKIL
jgi:hypothetical protein